MNYKVLETIIILSGHLVYYPFLLESYWDICNYITCIRGHASLAILLVCLRAFTFPG